MAAKAGFGDRTHRWPWVCLLLQPPPKRKEAAFSNPRWPKRSSNARCYMLRLLLASLFHGRGAQARSTTEPTLYVHHLFPDHASRTSHTEGPAARRTHAGGGSSTYLPRCAGQALSQSAVGLRGEARTTKQEPPLSHSGALQSKQCETTTTNAFFMSYIVRVDPCLFFIYGGEREERRSER